MMSSVEWDHEKSLLLISKFRTYEALWNSNSRSFHSPKMKEDAWWGLAKDIGSQVAEVKRKMECLRGSYRRERSRVRASLEMGRKYVPKWFAYPSLSFLDESKPHDVTDIGVMGVSCDVSTPMEKSGYLDTFDYILSNTKYGIPSNENHGNESFKPMEMTEPVKEEPNIDDSTSIPLSTSCEQQSKDDEKLSEKQEEDVSNVEDTEFIDKKIIALPHGKFKISPMRRRFCSRGPYKPIRLKPKLKKRKACLDSKSNSKSMESTAREPLVSLTERSSKCSPGWMEKFGEETSQSQVNEVEESEDSISKSQNTSRNSEGPKSSKENDSILLDFNKPLQKQDETQSDESTVFGQLVESTLRQLTAVQRVKAKMKLSKVLWEIELEALNGEAHS